MKHSDGHAGEKPTGKIGEKISAYVYFTSSIDGIDLSCYIYGIDHWFVIGSWSEFD